MCISKNRSAFLATALVLLLGACADVAAPTRRADALDLDPARRSALLAAVDDAATRLVPALTGEVRWTGTLAVEWARLGAAIQAGDPHAADDAAARLTQLLAGAGAAAADAADLDAMRLTLEAILVEL
jgi:hypothetical protein